MNDTLSLIVLALASYRVWHLVGMDQITEPLRSPLIRSEHPAATWVLDLIGCAFCLGFWLSVVLWVAWSLWPDLTVLLAAPFAISAVVGLLGKLDD